MEKYLPNPPQWAGCNARSIFKWSLTDLNSDFPSPRFVPLPRQKKSVFFTIYHAGVRIIGFIPFPKVLMLCEMQSTSSRIGTRLALSISFDYNHYTTDTSTIYIYIYIYVCVCVCVNSWLWWVTFYTESGRLNSYKHEWSIIVQMYNTWVSWRPHKPQFTRLTQKFFNISVRAFFHNI